MTKSCPLSLIDIDALPGRSDAMDRHLMEVDDTTCPSYRADERPCWHMMVPWSANGPPETVSECCAPVVMTLGWIDRMLKLSLIHISEPTRPY